MFDAQQKTPLNSRDVLTHFVESMERAGEHYGFGDPQRWEDARAEIDSLFEQLQAAEERLRQADEVLALYQDRDGDGLTGLQEQLEILRSAADDSLSILDSSRGGEPFSRGQVIVRLQEALTATPSRRVIEGSWELERDGSN